MMYKDTLNKSPRRTHLRDRMAGGVANPRHSSGYGCGLRLASHPEPQRALTTRFIQRILNKLTIFRDRIKILLAAGALSILPGCAALTGLDGDPSKLAEAPDYRVGDRWVYHVEEGFRAHLAWNETWEITKIDAAGVTVQITSKGERIDETRTEIWPQPGLVSQGALMNTETRKFNTPYQRYRFPMRAGDSWSQWLDTPEAKERQGQQPSLATRALGWKKIKTPVGEADALKLTQLITFDDADPWRWPTHGSYEIWYAPAVNNIVYAQKRASYIERGDEFGGIEIPAQLETVELLSYTRKQP